MFLGFLGFQHFNVLKYLRNEPQCSFFLFFGINAKVHNTLLFIQNYIFITKEDFKPQYSILGPIEKW